jgi:hypothetical protein
MATKVHEYGKEKFFKILKLNLWGRVKDWFKQLNPTPPNWEFMMSQKNGVYDEKKLWAKRNGIIIEALVVGSSLL